MAPLAGSVTLHVEAQGAGVGPAADDLRRDLAAVLGDDPRDVPAAADADIRITRDDALGREAWRVVIEDNHVRIIGGDARGVIFGIYAFSHQCLGVDPLHFWKELPPPQRDAISLKPRAIESTPATFRFRGWFINDEDLLSEWRLDGGEREIPYPFYGKVVHPEVMDKVCEALLRLGGNLIIPASFLDVMNPPEAELVRQCVKRGLYVSQHHIEPMGVSHFTFENYWRDRDEARTFSYLTDPEPVRQCWRDYAQRWWELAGEQMVWQVGLRGRGDVPVWENVEGITRANGGRYISRAMAEQLNIARSVDTRATPPATTTLWMEGSALMAEGSLTIPEGVAIIFADEGLSQVMQADFDHTPRDPGRDHGVYYHVGFWSRGPHLVQGTRPRKLKRELDRVVSKGDTHYAIVNTVNIREHVLGLEAAAACMNDINRYDPEAHLEVFAGPALATLYRELLDSFIDVTPTVHLQDGALWRIIHSLVDRIEDGRALDAPHFEHYFAITGLDGFPALLDEAAAKLDGVLARYDALTIPPRERAFFDANLRVQAHMLRGFCRCARALFDAAKGDAAALAPAEAELASVIETREAAACGRWRHWYRGDRKEDVPAMRARIRALMKADP